MRKRSSIFSSLGRLTPATTTMLAIIFVVIILMLVLLVQGSRMKRRIADIEENTRILEEQIDEEELLAEANKWEISHGGFSGRTAQQFIDHIVGTRS